jgi:hypothetical protein
MKKLLVKIFEGLRHPLDSLHSLADKINKKLDGFFDFSWTLGSLFAKIGFVIQGIFSIIFAFISLVFAFMNVDSIIDLVKGTVQGQSFWMEKLSNVVKGYPAFNDLVIGLDNNLSALSDFFTPPLTFTRILQVTGIGDAVNTIIVCAVQGVGFVISMRLLFWSLGRVKLTMIKPIK